MAKVLIKPEKFSPFGEIFSVMEEFFVFCHPLSTRPLVRVAAFAALFIYACSLRASERCCGFSARQKCKKKAEDLPRPFFIHE